MAKSGKVEEDTMQQGYPVFQTAFWEWFPITGMFRPNETWNKMFVSIGQFPLDTLDKKLDLIHRADKTEIQEQYLRIQKGELLEFGSEFRMKDDSGKYVGVSEFVMVLDFSREGKPQRVVGFVRKKKIATIKPGVRPQEGLPEMAQLISVLDQPCALISMPEGKFEFWNSLVTDLIGYDNIQISKMNVFELSAEPYRLRNEIERGEKKIPHCYFRSVEGLIFPIELSLAHFDVGGKKSVFCLFKNLYQHWQEEKKTRERLKSLEDTLRSLDDLVLIADQQGRIVEHIETNSPLSLEYTRLNLSGKPITELIPARPYQTFIRTFERMMETKEMQFLELPVKRGKAFWYQIRMNLRKDDMGQITGAVILVKDITPQRESESMYQESEARMQAFAELMPFAIAEILPDGSITYLNGQGYKLFGINRSAAKSKRLHLSQWISGEDFGKFNVLHNRIQHGSSQRVLDLNILRSDGRSVRVSCHLKYSLQGQSKGCYRLIMLDYSLQNVIEGNILRAKEQGERINQQKLERFASLMQTLSSPLRNLIGFSNFLATSGDQAPFKEDVLEVVKKNGDILGRLLNDLADMAAIEAGTLPLCMEEISMDEALNRAAAYIKGKGAQVTFDSATNLSESGEQIFLYTDRARFYQLLELVLMHAMIMAEGNDFWFGFSGINSDKARLIVEPVLSQALSRKISGFVVSPQKPETTVNNTQEDLINMEIAKGLAGILGGSISLNKQIIHWSIPVMPMVEKELHEKERIQKQFEGKSILVVDDDVTHNLFVKETFSEFCTNLSEAFTGQQCLYQCSRKKLPDVILLDVNLPDMSGVEVLNRLREKGIMVPVIAQTAFALPDDRKKFIAVGFNDCLPKPFSMNELLGSVAKQLE